MSYLKLLPPVCEKLQEEENLSSYLWLSMSDLKASFSCICEYWISCTCGFAISDLLLLPSGMWKATRRVNLSYVQFSMSDLKLLLCMWISCTCGFPFQICCFFCPVCEKMREEWISHTYLWFFSFHIWSFFLYVKNCKYDIWYGTLQCVICIPLFFVCLLEHEGEKSDTLGSTNIIIEICSVWLKILVLWDLVNNQQEHKICLLKLYSMIQGLRECSKTW